MFIAKNNDLIVLVGQTREELTTILNNSLFNYDTIEETEEIYELYSGKYLTVDEITEKERERKDALTLRRGDVFIGLIQARMINEQTLKAQIEAQMPETTDAEKMRKMLAINALENALNFHRGHDLVNEIGSELRISEENLDNFFETGDYHYLLPAYTFSIVTIPEDATIIINGEEQAEITLQYKPDGNLIEYEISAEGYITVTGSKIITETETLTIELEPEQIEE